MVIPVACQGVGLIGGNACEGGGCRLSVMSLLGCKTQR